ncbi:uncharacterized protein C2845_PM13G17470 [Panicum miliaceum]|uniref:Nucleotide-diphospho-sugar transferase domain-containing protein n=1 Tax=Panicum miliaceum TaxID=4540 RepID=A0A3L6RFV1_PANMI|nr:uncharacterized protein C2845_PM13G17470 [Panicum miliaceum]
MWLRDPFRHINLYADVTMSCDAFSGDPESLKNSPNTGFYYVKSTARTVAMVRYWRAARPRFPPHHDQKIFDNIKRELAGELGVRIAFLDTALFGTFCEFRDGIDGGVCTMHANCCIGLDNKVRELRGVVAAWKNYTALPPAEKEAGKVSLLTLDVRKTDRPRTYAAGCLSRVKTVAGRGGAPALLAAA